MSIRFRLIAMCFIVAVLPAIPVTFLVRNLLEKSFNVGLSTTVSEALESGMTISRSHMAQLQTGFEQEAEEIAALFAASPPDSARVAAALSARGGAGGVDGFIVGPPPPPDSAGGAADSLPGGLGSFAARPEFLRLLAGARVIERRPPAQAWEEFSFYETENKALQLALWHPHGRRNFLFYETIDPEFLGNARKLLDGRQIFAQLRLAQSTLSRSFFYPFIIIYGVMLVIALVLALFMAERMAAPVRRLVAAAAAVAAGDWRIQLRRGIGGEIGRLTEAFNLMVSRLEAQRRRLLDLEKMAAWREIARHLAHEIKNPLLPIRLAVQEMRDQYRGDDGAYRESLSESARVVEDELEHLQRLVREFSAFAKMPGLAPSTGSLERLVSDVARLYPQVETRIAADPSLPEFSFDPDQMRRVLINLFENAAGAVAEVEGASVAIEMTRRAESAVLVFSDSGPGIPEENLSRIFDPYFTTRRGGTGLGLALVKNIILVHGGTIEARNAAAGGAEFTVTLPLAGPRAAQAEAQTQGDREHDRPGADNR
jgi:nitrogen fixation/metabolism regulation signal transduction histidine kinase